MKEISSLQTLLIFKKRIENEHVINLMILIRVISINLVAIFIPAFFLEKLSLWAFTYYFAAYFIMSFASAHIFTFIVNKGLSYLSFFLSVLFFALAMLSINTQSYLLIFISSCFLALSERAFWMPLHFSYPFSVKRKEQEYAIINAIIYLAPFLSPLVGFLIINYFGYGSLFLSAIFFYSINIILFLYLKPLKFKHERIKHIFRIEPLYIADALKVGVLGVIWPAMLILIGWSLLNLSLLFSISSFIAGVLSFLYANIDDKKRESIASPSAFIHALSILLRTILISAASIIGTIIGYAANVLFDAHYMAYFYKRVKQDTSEVFNRELHIALTYLFIFLLSILFAIFPYETFFIFMLTTAIGSFYVSRFFRQ